VSFKDNKPGKYSFEVTMTDALGYNTLRKSVDVALYDKNGKLPSNRPPTAASQSLKAVPGLPLAVNLAGTDPDGDDLGFIVTEKPAHGRLSGTGGNLTYTPDFGYNGIDKLVFQAIDGQGMASTGTIKFNVSDKDVGVAVYEGFDYPPGPIEKRGGEPSFGFKGPWTNPKGTKDFYLVTDKSSSYSSLPSTGGKLMKGKGWWPLSRRLNPKVMSEHKLLDNGGELWFSMFMTPQKSNSHFDFTGKDISFGFRIDGFSIHTTLNGEKAGESKQASSRSSKLRFPDGPHMIIGHCVWGKTDTDPDTIKIYRVFDTPEFGPIVIDRPACIMKEVISQSKIDQISIKDFEKGSVDEIRIGPTLNSVMIGTKPLKTGSE
jgi:hypothetical protein